MFKKSINKDKTKSMNNFEAYKMDGLGNDFVIIDQRSRQIELSKDQIIKICNRKFIGCDQLIFIQNEEKSSPRLEFFNSDGSISGACGNGTRCAAQILSRENNEKEVEVKTSKEDNDYMHKLHKLKNLQAHLDMKKCRIEM